MSVRAASLTTLPRVRRDQGLECSSSLSVLTPAGTGLLRERRVAGGKVSPSFSSPHATIELLPSLKASKLASPPRKWQRLTGRQAGEWQDYSDQACRKIEKAYLAGDERSAVWENGTLHELDLRDMRQVHGTGMRALKRLKTVELKASAMQRPTEPVASRDLLAPPTASSAAGSARPDTRSASSRCSEMSEGSRVSFEDAERRLVHPWLAEMDEPRFQSKLDDEVPVHPFVRARCLDCKSEKTGDAAQTILRLADEYEEILQMPNPFLPVRGTPIQVMAAVCLAFHRSGRAARPYRVLNFFIGDDSPAGRSKAVSLKAEWREWRRLAKETAHMPLMMPVPTLFKDEYTWLKDNMSPQCVVERLAAAISSLQYVAKRRAHVTAEVVARTKLVLQQQSTIQRPGPNAAQSCRIWNATGRSVMDEAAARASQGRKVVAALPVRAQQKPGGALLEGGCLGPEEEACIRSNLHASLVSAGGRGGVAAADEKKVGRCSVEDGVLVSPGVQVFRGSAQDGFPWIEAPVNLSGVLSFTVPLPSSGSEAGRGSDRCKLQETLLLQKFELVVSEAQRLGAESLVVSACCGGPGACAVVRRVLGTALTTVFHEIEEVVLTD